MGIIPAAEYAILEASLDRMVTDLDVACHQFVDSLEITELPVIQTVRTGWRGRASKLINRTFLQCALKMRGPAPIPRLLDLQCCPRTVRRAAIRYGLVEPGPAVFRNGARSLPMQASPDH